MLQEHGFPLCNGRSTWKFEKFRCLSRAMCSKSMRFKLQDTRLDPKIQTESTTPSQAWLLSMTIEAHRCQIPEMHQKLPGHKGFFKNFRLRVHPQTQIKLKKNLHERQNGRRRPTCRERSLPSTHLVRNEDATKQWSWKTQFNLISSVCCKPVLRTCNNWNTALPSCLENIPCELKTMCCSLRLNACPQMSRIARKTLEESQQLFMSEEEQKHVEQLQSEYFIVPVRQETLRMRIASDLGNCNLCQDEFLVWPWSSNLPVRIWKPFYEPFLWMPAKTTVPSARLSKKHIHTLTDLQTKKGK